jgi:hypothetical protein
MFTLRRFTSAGMESFSTQLERIQQSPNESFDRTTALSAHLTEIVSQIDVEEKDFRSKAEAGEYLYQLFDRIRGRKLERDPNLWAWLSAIYFEQLRKPNSKPGHETRWIPQFESGIRYYRHKLLGPYLVTKTYRNNPQLCNDILCRPLQVHGEFEEQMFSTPYFASNEAIMSLAVEMYIDKDQDDFLRKGAANKKAGGLRHFVAVLNQIYQTWDLRRISKDQLIQLLPVDFDKYLQ